MNVILHTYYCSALELQTKVREDVTITETASTRAFSGLKAPTSSFTFKTLLRHYAKRALTPQSLNVKLGLRRKGHKGTGGLVSIVFYSPSLMIIVSRTQFHVERLWGQRLFSIVS